MLFSLWTPTRAHKSSDCLISPGERHCQVRQLVYLSLTLNNFISPSRFIWQLLPRLYHQDETHSKEKHRKLQDTGNRWWLQHESCCVSNKYHVLRCCPSVSILLSNIVVTSHYNKLAKTNGKTKQPAYWESDWFELRAALLYVRTGVFDHVYNLILILITLNNNTDMCRFMMKKRNLQATQRTVCANPDLGWVQKLVQAVDKRMQMQI